MKIQIEPPVKHQGAIIMSADELNLFYNGMVKLMPYIEENKKLGFNAHKRIKALEREFIIDFTQRLEEAVSYINTEEK